ncbi:MAG TPA: methyltransferase domain-containing protein [Streptosporangiaceae bacterium]|nr:methyltransferase domain-containing protein [Streptosporangiaceae bacterium]
MNGVPDHVASPAEVRAMIDRYVDELKAAAAFESAAVERALRRVERHRLLETFYFRTAGERQTIEHGPGHPRRDHLALIYADTALATRHIDGLPASSTSQASLVARMLELLEVGEGMKILEVGAGTGYNAALLAEIAGDQRLVVTMDVLEDVVAQTRRLLAGAGYPDIGVLLQDGFEGVAEQAPFDRIVATVGSEGGWGGGRAVAALGRATGRRRRDAGAAEACLRPSAGARPQGRRRAARPDGAADRVHAGARAAVHREAVGGGRVRRRPGRRGL